MAGKTFLFTGGTGFLGPFLAAELLKGGDKIIFLGRAKGDQSLASRVAQSLKSVEYKIDSRNITAFETDFQKINLGIDDADLKKIEGRINGIWHLAADLSFKEKDRERVFNTNVNGLKNVLVLAERLKCPFYYVSTVYAHGYRPGEKIFEEELTKPSKFNNAYEESKFEAERFIRRWGESNNNNFIIFRPSILIEKKQRALSFFGYYAILYSLHKIKSVLRGKKIICFFPYSRNSSLNLMFAETAAAWMKDIASKQGVLGKTFHIVNPRPFSIRELAEQTFGAFNIKIIPVKIPKTAVKLCFSIFCFLGSLFSGTKKIAKKFQYYKYYITENNNYDMANVKNILGRDVDKEFILPDNFIMSVAEEFSKKIEERSID